MPVANMWCTHTPKLMNADGDERGRRPRGSPASRCRENTGMIIEIMPVAGTNRMYTSGWPQNQNRCWYSSALPPRADDVERACRTGGRARAAPAATRHGRHREEHHEREHEHRPHEDRHAVQRHARRAQLEDRDDEVDRADGGRDADEDDAEAPEVDVDPRRVRLRRSAARRRTSRRRAGGRSRSSRT